MIAELVALALSGPLDRLRGDARHILGARILDKIALGVCMAVLAGYPHPTLWAVLIGALGFGPAALLVHEPAVRPGGGGHRNIPRALRSSAVSLPAAADSE